MIEYTVVKEIENKADKGEEDTTSNVKTHNEIQKMIRDVEKFEKNFKEYDGIEIEEDDPEDIEIEDVELYPVDTESEEPEFTNQDIPEQIVEPDISEEEYDESDIQPRGRITGIQQLKEFAELTEAEQQEELPEPIIETDEPDQEVELQEPVELPGPVSEVVGEKVPPKKDVTKTEPSKTKPASSAVFNVGFGDDGKLVNLDMKKPKPKKTKEKSETESKSSKFKGGLGKLKKAIPFRGKEE